LNKKRSIAQHTAKTRKSNPPEMSHPEKPTSFCWIQTATTSKSETGAGGSRTQ